MLLLLACDPPAEPLDLPADPSAAGVPVGVTTVYDVDQTFEIWYPASDTTTGPGESPDFDQFLPAALLDHVGDVHFPTWDSGAVRDAPIRVPEVPYPVVFFSHGFGGMRLQSLDYTTHLASRGYVVIAPDHPGRMMGDVLPCLFSPPLEGCDLSSFSGDDPAVDDLEEVLLWAGEANEEGFFEGLLNMDHVGLSGHSAGAGSTITSGDAEPRYTALLPMAGYGAPTRDVPTLLLGGTCDSFALDADATTYADQLLDGGLVRLFDAGHLAFSDLCELDLAANADAWLAGRDDLNDTIYALLLQLATDGCPGAVPSPDLCDAEAFLPLETSAPVIRHYSTVFFDAELRGSGPGVEAGVFEDAEVR